MSIGADNFADATVIPDPLNYLSDATPNAAYTSETSEPAALSWGNTRSAWWKFTPSASARLLLDTGLSENTGAGVDTKLSVYSGPAFDATFADLVSVGADDDSGWRTASQTSLLGLYVAADTTYYVQVAAHAGAVMNYRLRIAAEASSILYALPVTIPTAADTYDSGPVSNANADTEPNEPTPIQYTNSRSMWWRFVPAANGTVAFSTATGGVDTQMAVYSGPATLAVPPNFAGLTVVGTGGDNGPGASSIATIAVTASTVYYVQVGAWAGGDMNYRLTVSGVASAVETPPPTGITWWDGTAEQVASLEGWFDGTATQPATVEGWWDGAAVVPL